MQFNNVQSNNIPGDSFTVISFFINFIKGTTGAMKKKVDIADPIQPNISPTISPSDINLLRFY